MRSSLILGVYHLLACSLFHTPHSKPSPLPCTDVFTYEEEFDQDRVINSTSNIELAGINTTIQLDQSRGLLMDLIGVSMYRHMKKPVQQNLMSMCTLINEQQNEITSLKNDLSKLSLQSYGQKNEIKSLKNDLSKLSLQSLGTLVWKISEYSDKFEDARSEHRVELKSPPFYTSQFGYKLQALLWLNGNGIGDNTHVSVFIRILRGEYDALLKWPFQPKFTLTLFEQCEKPSNIVYSVAIYPGLEYFKRPGKVLDFQDWGSKKFVSHETLKKGQFVKEDTMFIEVKVEPP